MAHDSIVREVTASRFATLLVVTSMVTAWGCGEIATHPTGSASEGEYTPTVVYLPHALSYCSPSIGCTD